MLLDLICLANARKRSERCVACLRTDGGGWIRLVSKAEHGELTVAQRTLGEHGEPQNFDLIRVEVLYARAVPGQPENWLIGGRPWQLLERPASAKFHAMFASHLQRDHLVFGSASDRLAAGSFPYHPPASSLALLKPGGTSFEHRIDGSKKRVRALFHLGKNWFNLSVTDPPFEQKLKCLPAGKYPPQVLQIPDPNRLFFCASLGESFEDGNCYKLVAGVLVLPQDWPDI